jgi:hypothetical protein
MSQSEHPLLIGTKQPLFLHQTTHKCYIKNKSIVFIFRYSLIQPAHHYRVGMETTIIRGNSKILHALGATALLTTLNQQVNTSANTKTRFSKKILSQTARIKNLVVPATFGLKNR